MSNIVVAMGNFLSSLDFFRKLRMPGRVLLNTDYSFSISTNLPLISRG